MRHIRSNLALLGLLTILATATVTDPKVLDKCPGYNAQNIINQGRKLYADLILAGDPCNVFGNDIEKLKLEVTYENENRLHVKITDPSEERYEIPEDVLPRPTPDVLTDPLTSHIRFNFTTSPFAFSVYRARTHEVLFSTAAHPLIFEPQYLRVKTTLPARANLYGLGEHTDTFRLPTHNYTRTLWSRDAYGVPQGTNLYGNHPVYFEHRATGTHGVFLANSNGMDVKIDDGAAGELTTLEYNVIGGVLDFYFLAGSESDPMELVRQYSDIVGKPAEVPYWSFGLHQCRFGYQNYIDVSEVITNYSAAGIPLETMWTDIGTSLGPYYMDRRRIFTVDPDYFPLDRMREVVAYLHSHDQKFVLMVDPAVAYLPDEGYGPYDRGTAEDIWLKAANGSSPFLGAVWPGVTVFPDWFNPKTQDYWSNEFQRFFNPETGLDIDGAWIDMNEPSSFCNYPCDDPFAQAKEQALPPPRSSAPPEPNAPIFGQTPRRQKRVDHSKDDVQAPPYAIANFAGAGPLSDKTAYTDAVHSNGLIEYDTHNLYGTMMSTATHNAMLARRPGLRTLVITRSTFAGAGARVGKWLGDNFSQWAHYRQSIPGVLAMAGIYHVPMVGADVCGYAENTTETLCARWASLGAFYPFMRNHNADTAISQEFYRWPTTARAARTALATRYRLLDYLATAFHAAATDGTPVLSPLWYHFPRDERTFALDTQFFFGPAVLVSPVLSGDGVDAYVPPGERFYEFHTLARVAAGAVRFEGVDAAAIPLAIKGGAVLPLRAAEGALTTAEVRRRDFEIVIVPGRDGRAAGRLYVDDGVSAVVAAGAATHVEFAYAEGRLDVRGTFGYALGVRVARVRIAGVERAPWRVRVNGREVGKDRVVFDAQRGVLDVKLGIPFRSAFTVKVE